MCGTPTFSRNLLARIINGRPVQKGTTPWAAMLSHPDGQPFCGGSLLGKERWKGWGTQDEGGLEERDLTLEASTPAAGPRSTMW